MLWLIENARPPLPPFTFETATLKVRKAEDAWNTRDPEKVSLAYTAESVWRNREQRIQGRAAIVALLSEKWARELEYRLCKELWGFGRTGWRCGLCMRATTRAGSGGGVLGMSFGSLMKRG